MANIQGIEVIIRARDKASAEIGKIAGKISVNADKIRRAGKTIAMAGTAVTGAFALMAKSAAEQQTIFNRLQTAVENAGISWTKAKPKIDAFTSAMQKMTVYGDTQTAKVLQDLLPYTNDLSKAMEGAKVAMDMASAGLFDIKTATKYIGMAMQGNVEMLGRYVGELRTSTNAELKNMTIKEKTAYALDLLREKYGGMAENELNTFVGRVKQLKNYLSDTFETIGDILLPILTELAKKFTIVIQKVKKFAEEHPKLTKYIVLATAALGALAIPLGTILMLLPGIIAGATALSGALTPIATVAAAIGLALAGWKLMKLIAGLPRVRRLLEKLSDAFESLKETILNLWEKIKTKTTEVVEEIEGKLSDLGRKVQESAGVWRMLFALMSGGATETLRLLNDSLSETTVNLGKIEVKTRGVTGSWEEMGGEIENAGGISEAVSEKINNVFSGIQANITKAMESIQGDLRTWQDTAEDVILAIRDTMADGFSQMILEGGKFRDAMKDIWENMKVAFVKGISEMLADWMLFQMKIGKNEGGIIGNISSLLGWIPHGGGGGGGGGTIGNIAGYFKTAGSAQTAMATIRMGGANVRVPVAPAGYAGTHGVGTSAMTPLQVAGQYVQGVGAGYTAGSLLSGGTMDKNETVGSIMGSLVGTFLGGPLGGLVGGAIGQGIGRKVGNTVRKIGHKIGDVFGWQEGGIIPSTGFGVVHKDEYVLSTRQQTNLIKFLDSLRTSQSSLSPSSGSISSQKVIINQHIGPVEVKGDMDIREIARRLGRYTAQEIRTIKG